MYPLRKVREQEMNALRSIMERWNEARSADTLQIAAQVAENQVQIADNQKCGHTPDHSSGGREPSAGRRQPELADQACDALRYRSCRKKHGDRKDAGTCVHDFGPQH